MTDYYEVLGVPKTATPVEIKKAYRTLAARYHPDKHRGNELEELARDKLTALNEAYAVLSDPARRAQYDSARSFARHDANTPQPAADPQRALWSLVRFFIVLSIAFFVFRFIRHPRAIAVIAAAILVAWFAPRLIRLFRSKK